MPPPPHPAPRLGTPSQSVVSQKRLQDLVSEIDPKQILDEDVEEVSHLPRQLSA